MSGSFGQPVSWLAYSEGLPDPLQEGRGTQITHHPGGLNLITLRIDKDNRGHSIHTKLLPQEFRLGLLVLVEIHLEPVEGTNGVN